MRASELNSGMNVIEIIDEYFQMTRTFCPDHENIIDISPPCVRLPRGVSESVGFEHTKKKHYSIQSSLWRQQYSEISLFLGRGRSGYQISFFVVLRGVYSLIIPS